MKKSYLALLFCFSILQACGSGGTSDGGGDPGGSNGGGNSQSLSLNPIGNKTVLGGETLSFTLSSSNPNGGTLTYMADGNNNATNPFLLSGISFNESTGAFSWSTQVGYAGVYNVQFSVSNNNESDSESITITVQDIVTYGEGLYITYCQSCHGVNGVGGNQSIVQGSSPLDVRDALGLEANSARSGMGNIASQFENQTRDANAIGYFLCDAGGLDINNTQRCPVN